jgi:hypothetical protein
MITMVILTEVKVNGLIALLKWKKNEKRDLNKSM